MDIADAPGKKKKVASNKSKKNKKKPKTMKKVPCAKASPKSPKGQPRKKEGCSAGYKAGSFGEERLKYMRSLMSDKNLSWKDASASWANSARRAELLKGMSPSELSRRRFVLPKAKS